jgi:hypothetical protein
MDGYKVLRLEGDVVARDLDELRVFALELIELNPKYDATDKQHMTAKLAVVLIQGCDPTAEWILKTFGASNA